MSCDVASPGALWEAFKQDFIEDHLSSFRNSQLAELAALRELARELATREMRLADFPGMPTIPDDADHIFATRLLRQELDYDTAHESAAAMRLRTSMNTEQAAAFDSIRQIVDASSGGVFFLEGIGGSGKTYVYNALLHYVRGHGKIACASAFSGVAALLLIGGQTSHKRFGLPISDGAGDVQCTLSAQEAVTN